MIPFMQSLKRQKTVSHIIYRQIQTGYIKLVTHSPLFTRKGQQEPPFLSRDQNWNRSLNSSYVWCMRDAGLVAEHWVGSHLLQAAASLESGFRYRHYGGLSENDWQVWLTGLSWQNYLQRIRECGLIGRDVPLGSENKFQKSFLA